MRGKLAVRQGGEDRGPSCVGRVNPDAKRLFLTEVPPSDHRPHHSLMPRVSASHELWKGQGWGASRRQEPDFSRVTDKGSQQILKGDSSFYLCGLVPPSTWLYHSCDFQSGPLKFRSRGISLAASRVSEKSCSRWGLSQAHTVSSTSVELWWRDSFVWWFRAQTLPGFELPY